MRKVMLLTPFYKPNIGGAETFAEELKNVLEKNFKVTLCCLRHKHTWDNINSLESGILLTKLFPEAYFSQLIRRHDTIYALGLTAGYIVAILKKIFKVKLYITLLALYPEKNDLIGWTLKQADKVFVEGQGGKDNILQYNLKNIVKFNHWVNQDIFTPITHNGKFRVLFVGRPIKKKGKHIIEEAQKLLPNRIEFTYVHGLPYCELLSKYQESDVLVIPSLYEEGFVRVCAEGASCGCIIIASNRGSLPEMVRDFGIVIEPTPENFAGAILSLYKNRQKFNFMRNKTFAYSRKCFSEKNGEVFLS